MFFTILVTMAAPHFFCTLDSLNSISEPNNPVCVLGAINEHYEVLCDVGMYVSLCLKLSVNYGQRIAVFVFFHETDWVYKGLRILNLEGQQNCMIGSKVTAFLPPFFFLKNFKNFKHRHVGCLSRGNILKYCAAHSYFILGHHI